jgi:hypothetical protein
MHPLNLVFLSIIVLTLLVVSIIAHHTTISCIMLQFSVPLLFILNYLPPTFLLLLAGDIELNPGPTTNTTTPPGFTICTLNIQSMINKDHQTSLFDLTDTYHFDFVALSETFITSDTTKAQYLASIPPKYDLLASLGPRQIVVVAWRSSYNDLTINYLLQSTSSRPLR